MDELKVQTAVGGEAAIAAMDQYSRMEIGRKTYNFVRRCMRDPALKARIRARAAELRGEVNGHGTEERIPH